mgnify:CR=1 FL=1
MKRFLILIILLIPACSNGQTSVLEIPEEIPEERILIVVGEGGVSGDLFSISALTYQREHGGELVEVSNGDEFVEAIERFSVEGAIDHLEYFGHGNNVALFVNQEPGVNGALYANDPERSRDYVAASIYEVHPSVFSETATVQFNGCNVAEDHESSETFAQDFANHFQVEVTAAQGPTQFSSSPDAIVDFDEWRRLELTTEDNVYMLPSYLEEGFVLLVPAALSKAGYVDVYRGTPTTEAIDWLYEQGVDFGEYFRPYETASADDLVQVCGQMNLDCDLESISGKQKTLMGLKIIVDAYGQSPGVSNPWYEAYVSKALNESLLPDGFTDQLWMTRSDLAYLVFNLETN